MFRASSLPIIRSFLLYIRHWQVSCRFMMTVSKQSQDGNSLFVRNIVPPVNIHKSHKFCNAPFYFATCFGPTTPRRSAIAKQNTVYMLKYPEDLAMALTFSFLPVTEKPGFDTSSVLVVVEKVVLVAVFLRVRLFSPICIIPPILHPQLHLHVLCCQKQKVAKPGKFPNSKAVSEIRDYSMEKNRKYAFPQISVN